MALQNGRRRLSGKVALVAGASRGAGRAIAVELARAGAYVYATGRSRRVAGSSGIGRPETIEETGEMMEAVGGSGVALWVDHLEPQQVASLVARVEREHEHLDILVNDIFGGDRYAQWDRKLWDHDLARGLRMLRMGVDTHLIISAKAVPLMLRSEQALLIEMPDGTPEYNQRYRGTLYYDLVQANVERIVLGLTAELAGTGVTALGVTPGWLRSEAMLEIFGVTETTWRDALAKDPHFCVSESPSYVARGVVALAADHEVRRCAGRVLSSAELARTYGVTDIDGSQPDFWRYLVEIHDAGRSAVELGYR